MPELTTGIVDDKLLVNLSGQSDLMLAVLGADYFCSGRDQCQARINLLRCPCGSGPSSENTPRSEHTSLC